MLLPNSDEDEKKILEILDNWLKRTNFVIKPKYIYNLFQRDVNNYIYQDEHGRDLRGMAEIIIAKHRNGAVGSILLNFKGHFARFQNRNSDDFVPLPGEEIGMNLMQNTGDESLPPMDIPMIPPSGEVPF
jgi:hypothetical protein